MTDEIIEKVMQGDSKSEDYEMLKRMFPEFFEVVTKDIEKAINLQQEQTNQNIKEFIEELKKHFCWQILSFEDDPACNECRRCIQINNLTLKYFPQITNQSSEDNKNV